MMNGDLEDDAHVSIRWCCWFPKVRNSLRDQHLLADGDGGLLVVAARTDGRERISVWLARAERGQRDFESYPAGYRTRRRGLGGGAARCRHLRRWCAGVPCTPMAPSARAKNALDQDPRRGPAWRTTPVMCAAVASSPQRCCASLDQPCGPGRYRCRWGNFVTDELRGRGGPLSPKTRILAAAGPQPPFFRARFPRGTVPVVADAFHSFSIRLSKLIAQPFFSGPQVTAVHVETVVVVVVP